MLGGRTLMMSRRLGAGFEGFYDDHTAAAGGACELVWLLLIDGRGRLGIECQAVILSVQETACQSDIVGTVGRP